MVQPMKSICNVIQKAVTLVILAAGACGLLGATRLAQGDLLIGKPTDIDHEAFAAKLEMTSKKAWSQLANDSWHVSAVDRFFVAGPLDSAQLQKFQNLSKSNISDSDLIEKLKNLSQAKISTSDLIEKLQQVATAEYKMSKSVPGTGDINTSLWTVLFQCSWEVGCIDGYMVPMVLVPRTIEGRRSGYFYASIWQQPATDIDILINAIPASIKTRPTTLMEPLGKFNFSRVCSIHDVPSCARNGLAHFTTLLDSAYGFASSIACAQLRDDTTSFNVLLVGFLTQLKISPFFSHFPFFQEAQEDSFSSRIPLDQCVGAPMLQLNESNLVMCHRNNCIVMTAPTPKNENNSTAARNYTLLQVVKSTLDDLNSSLSQCSSSDMEEDNCKALDQNLFLLPSESIRIFSHSFAFSVGEQFFLSSFLERLSWHALPSESLSACSLVQDSVNAVEAFEIEVREYLKSYIEEHNTAFTTSKGPATDPYTFYALIITTALSVISIAVPFTDFLLRAICHARPFYLKSRSKHGAASRAFKALMHVVGNVVISLAFLLPVLSLAKNEVERQNAFSTWDLTTNDIQLPDTSGVIRAMYLISVTSKYESHFLNVIVLAICITIVAVAVCTARRCLLVFGRYDLLLEESLQVTANESQLQQVAAFTSSSAFARAMKAIEMGEAEYLDLQQRVKGDLELSTHVLFKNMLPAHVLKQRTSRSCKY